MSNQITPTNINPVRDQLVTQSSRYANSSVVYYGKNNIITFTTYKRTPITPDNANDKFMVVNSGEEFRPDLVSYKVYGVSDYWWKIMEFNNIWDVYDFKAGTNLRIPSNIF